MKYYIENNSVYVAKRIDRVVSMLDNSLSRSYATMLIQNKNILVNGKVVKPAYILKGGETIDICLPIIQSDIIPQNIEVPIIYEDNDIIIINKPKGLVVHPGAGNKDKTLVNSLMYSHKDNLSTINGVLRPGIVHRIDKDTSGVIVVAKTDEAHKKLSEVFKEHNITRKYIALVDGIIKKDRLRINLPIGRDSNNRIKYAVSEKNSKTAITNISVLKRYPTCKYTLIEASLETGRTHQIRVHMAYINHALVGDSIYGKKKNEFNIKGQMLHATTLGFNHPITNKYVEFSSQLPKEFEEILKGLN